MQTYKEALMAAFTGEMPEFIPPKDKAYTGVVFPGDRFFSSEEVGKDAWGVTWKNLGPDPGLDGSMVLPGTEVFDDVSQWRDYVKFPDLDQLHAKEILLAMKAGTPNWDQCVTNCMFLSGPWERLNEFMGMEEAMCAFYDDPDAVKEFLEAMVDYKIKCIDLAIDTVDPDVIHMHDDWGFDRQMMFPLEMWREFIKPGEMRIAKHIHDRGKIYEHHSCGYIEPLFPDFIEIGIDAVDPVMAANDVAKLKKEFGSRITICGGVDNQRIDFPDTPEEVIRGEVRRVMDAYAYGGRYIPEFIFTNRRVREIFMDEVEKYGKDIYKK